VKIVAIYSWNCTCYILTGKVQRAQEVAYEKRIVALEILDVERRIERPEISTDKKNFTESAIAPSYNSWPFNLGLIVIA
jgi:hypothetical protein